VVHNGVIENYATLKRQLQSEGVVFQSDTDTEVIAQLIAYHYDRSTGSLPRVGDWSELTSNALVEAVSKTLAQLKGTYGLAVLSPRYPDLIIGARLGSPLVLGLGEGENFLASDPGALVGKADKVVFLQDHQLCVLTPDEWHILDHERGRVEAAVQEIDWETAD